jgi:hypothetical protein
MLKVDQEVLTKILGNNPTYVLSALRAWAYAWSEGMPSQEELEEQDAINTLPYFVAGMLIHGGGRDLSLGGQHIPEFLRMLADRIEDAQIDEIRRAVARQGPLILNRMGSRFNELYRNPPIRLVEDKAATDKLRASGAHLRPKSET